MGEGHAPEIFKSGLVAERRFGVVVFRRASQVARGALAEEMDRVVASE
jgi:hypothetical protein